MSDVVEMICQGQCSSDGNYAKKKFKLGKATIGKKEFDAYLCPDCGFAEDKLIVDVEQSLKGNTND